MKKEFNFIQSRKICVIISLCIFAVGILFNVIFGTGMDVSFSGGTLVRYSYAEKIDVNAVQAMAQDVLGKDAEASLENVDNTDVVTVTFPKEITLEQQTKLNERMTKDFKDNKPVQVEAKTLSAPMGRQFFVKCLAAIALAATRKSV